MCINRATRRDLVVLDSIEALRRRRRRRCFLFVLVRRLHPLLVTDISRTHISIQWYTWLTVDPHAGRDYMCLRCGTSSWVGYEA